MPTKVIRLMIVALMGVIAATAGGAFTRTPVTAENGMVVSSQRIASEVGVEILKQGGNAIDAAVAVGYALAVVNPCCGNIGGGGFATLKLADGREVFLNFREKAPGNATEIMYLDAKGEVVKDASLKGYLAVAVPGTVLGLDTLLAKYGTLPRDRAMAPAIKLAEEGFELSQGDAAILARAAHELTDANVAAIFAKDGKPLQAGDRLIQKNLARTLAAIAKDGPDTFYRGAIADAVVAASAADVRPGVPPHEGTETTHYSVIDKAGNAVAVTYTINALFGAKVIAGDTGFFLNDEMDDFTVKPGVANLFGLVQGKNNAIAPGKRPLSSMSPTIVLKDSKPFMVVGSPGGSRIISIVAQTIINVVDGGMTIQEAVNGPRLHHQWLPDEIAAERFALSPDTRKILEAMGHKVAEQSPWGAAEAILIGPKEAAPAASSGNDAAALSKPLPGLIYGGHDDRRPAGAASGY